MQYILIFLTIIKSIYATVESLENTHTHTQKKAREKNITHALKPVNILIHVGPVFTVLHV